jgi:RNA polymerase sigma-70 factor (ECF subfamily)
MNQITAEIPHVKSLPAEDEERELAARVARGESKAFEQLIDRYGQRVVRLAARLLNWSAGAEDVAQDVFLAVLEKRTVFRGEARLWTYLTTITVNRCRSLRRRRWIYERALRVIAPYRNQPTVGDSLHERDTLASEIRAAVGKLPDNYREVVVLRYFEELKTSEVAQVLGVKTNTVEVRLSRARKMLEDTLGHLADSL